MPHLALPAVTLNYQLDGEAGAPVVMLSNSLESVRVSLLLDAIGTVSAIVITAR
jgi:hypothetical protein